jgi:surface carbohydrate biosynthesis protein
MSYYFSFQKLDQSNPDVIIIDTNGLEFTKKCIPREMTYSSIDIRSKIPFILSLNFFFRLTLNLFKYKFKPVSLIYSIIETLKPNAIISLLDTSRLIGQLSLKFPELLVISIQNGVRTLPIDFNCEKGKFHLPIYFSFGEYEKDFIAYRNVPYIEVNEVGSLKLSLFLQKSANKINDNSICFISQYISKLTTSKDKIGRDFISRLEEIYKNLLICSNPKKINVAMRFNRMDAEYNNERTFFLNLSKNSNLIENDRSNFSSYKLAFSSSVIVAMDSTLAFEMFGSGKRVLFCDFAKHQKYMNRKGVEFLFSKLPKELVLESFDIDEMQSKINALISMSEISYNRLTKISRNYYLKKTNIPTNEIISTYLKKNITKHPKKYVQ